jgi:hypothetical protein
MNRRSILAMTATSLIGFCAISMAKADEVLKYRHVQHVNSVQSQDIGDIDGHVVSVVKNSGIAFFADGSTGTTAVSAVADYVKGTGPIVLGYASLNFDDGSALWFKFSGTAVVEGTRSVQQGTGTIIGGKGRYEGAKGDVTWSAVRVAPLATGADSYVDNVVTIKK